MIEKVNLGDYKVKYSYIEEKIEIGYITIEETFDVINIIDVMVNEKKRNEGIASKILSSVINDYKGKDVRFMLEVREDNNIAIKLYKKFGFKVIYVREKYYKTVDALIMEKSE